MPLNPVAKQILDSLVALKVPPMPTLSPLAARNTPSLNYAIDQMQSNPMSGPATSAAKTSVESVKSITHVLIPGPDGELLARIYRPTTGGPLPVIVYFHGGGWVIATLDTYDSSCRSLANETGMIVVSVSYRQAPENKFPAAVNDAYAAYQWIRKNAGDFGGDPGWVAVAGESAGGNLATVTCLKARENGFQLPDFQLLVYPVTDLTSESPSYLENAEAIPLSAPMMRWFRKHYLESPADAQNPYASPLLAPNLSGLPPAHIVTVAYDPLRDEGESYAHRLKEAGVPTTMKRYGGLMHEAFGLGGAIPEAKTAMREAAMAVKEAYQHVLTGSKL